MGRKQRVYSAQFKLDAVLEVLSSAATSGATNSLSRSTTALDACFVSRSPLSFITKTPKFCLSCHSQST